MSDYAQQLAAELNLSAKNVQGAIDLIDQGNTIPFIARYRKEVTGSMDDQVLRDLGDRLEYLRGLDKRKEEVTSSITEQGAMTPELTAALQGQDAGRGRGPLPPLQAQAQDPRQHRQGSRAATPGRCAVQAGRCL